nr:MAG TPA: hypothetical protein [Caudoviricetes sp.]
MTHKLELDPFWTSKPLLYSVPSLHYTRSISR